MINSTRTRSVAKLGATLVIAAFGLAIPILMPAPAEAFVGVSISVPLGFPFYPPYPPPYYYPPPPPAYYPPSGSGPPAATQPPGGYAPSAASSAPSITYTPRRAWTDASGRQCREYTTTREIEGRMTKIYGTACRDPDGQWRIVN